MARAKAADGNRRRRTAKGKAKRPSKYVRVAVYGDGSVPPHTEDVPVAARRGATAAADRVAAIVQDASGRVPAAAIHEVVANLAHAEYQGAAVTVLDQGNRVRVSDCGAGISDVERALLPGYSSARGALRSKIRGVGAGLPLAKAAMEAVGGRLTVDSNIAGGVVVTLDARAPEMAREEPPAQAQELSDRHKRVLALLREVGEAGPTMVAQELGAGIGTAHRALTALEHRGLVVSDARGKRRLTDEGLRQLGLIFRG